MKGSFVILTIIFWILLLLAAIGCFVPLSPPWQRGNAAIILIELAILGLKVLGNPVH